MPLYVYQCEKGHKTEAIRTISEMNDAPLCECGLRTQKIITPVMFSESFLGSAKNPGYLCPVTNKYVETKRERLNIMAKHDLVEYSGATPKS